VYQQCAQGLTSSFEGSQPGNILVPKATVSIRNVSLKVIEQILSLIKNAFNSELLNFIVFDKINDRLKPLSPELRTF